MTRAARARIHDPDRPARPAASHFGTTPFLAYAARWSGPGGEEESFTAGDFKVWPVWSGLRAMRSEFPSIAEMAELARVGINAFYQFFYRLERSGLGIIVRDECRRIVDVVPNYSIGYAASAVAEMEKDRASKARTRRPGRPRRRRETPPDTPLLPSEPHSEPPSDEPIHMDEGRAPGRALFIHMDEGARAGARALLLESSKEGIFESTDPDPIRSLPLGEPGPGTAAATPDPTPTIPAAAPPPEPAPGPAPDPEPTPEQLAEWERQAADDRPSAAVDRWQARAALGDWRERHAARAAGSPPPAPDVVLTPVMGRWPEMPAPAPSPAAVPVVPTIAVDLETRLRQVANREGFADQVVEIAARELARELADPFGLGPYLRLMAEVREGRLKGRQVLDALKCTRGPAVRSRPAVFHDAVKKVRSQARANHGRE